MGVPLDTCAECYWEALARFSFERSRPHLTEIYFVLDDPSIATEIHRVIKKEWIKAIRSPSSSSSGVVGSSYYQGKNSGTKVGTGNGYNETFSIFAFSSNFYQQPIMLAVE